MRCIPFEAHGMNGHEGLARIRLDRRFLRLFLAIAVTIGATIAATTATTAAAIETIFVLAGLFCFGRIDFLASFFSRRDKRTLYYRHCGKAGIGWLRGIRLNA